MTEIRTPTKPPHERRLPHPVALIIFLYIHFLKRQKRSEWTWQLKKVKMYTLKQPVQTQLRSRAERSWVCTVFHLSHEWIHLSRWSPREWKKKFKRDDNQHTCKYFETNIERLFASWKYCCLANIVCLMSRLRIILHLKGSFVFRWIKNRILHIPFKRKLENVNI